MLSTQTKIGRKILDQTPETHGSLGIAISEAVEIAANQKSTKYSLGSVLNHVLLHQTIIGMETKKQLKLANENPDIMIGCVGGGSNFGGFILPFVKDKLNGSDIEFLACEARACPTITKGDYKYDFGDTGGITPLIKMYTMGHDFVPEPIHAGGLRYHGMSPIISLLCKNDIIKGIAYPQKEIFESAITFTKTEGILPAPESAHAIKATIDKAIECRKNDSKKTIVFNLSGHGHFDLSAYKDFLEGKIA